MTPQPSIPDPVAALAFILEESGLSYEQPPAEDAKRVWDEMAEAGYVLVNVDMLAEAIHDADSAKHPIGGDWRPGACPYHEGMADAILAALEKQP